MARLALSQRYVFFGLAGLSLLMWSIDSTIVSVAVPSMMRDLNTSLVWIGWTLTGYTLSQTIMMPLAGKLSEQFGRMRVFLACVLLFTLGSLLCGLAPSVWLLIAYTFLRMVLLLKFGWQEKVSPGAGFLSLFIGFHQDFLVALITTIPLLFWLWPPFT